MDFSTEPILTKEVKKIVALRSNMQCERCHIVMAGRPKMDLNARSLDHIQDQADGGTHEESNLQNLCRRCNTEKSKVTLLRRRQLGRELTTEESIQINRAFLAQPEPIVSSGEVLEFLRKYVHPISHY